MGTIQGSINFHHRFTAGAILHRSLLALPIAFVAIFLLLPLAFTFAVSFWPRAGLMMVPGFTLASYEAFFGGVRLLVLERSLRIAAEATVLSLLIAYPIAWFLATRASRGADCPVADHGAIPDQLHHSDICLDLAAGSRRTRQWPAAMAGCREPADQLVAL
jgi:hypothetical protein